MHASTNFSTPTEWANEHLWVLILAGGVGSRFWPVSTPERPKQLLPLGSPRPLIEDTVARARRLVPDRRLRILTGPAMVAPFRSCIPDLGDEVFLLEPAARGTCPVLAWAAWKIRQIDPDAVLVSLHADHVIEPEDAFAALIQDTARLADRQRSLFTVAVPPTRPEVGYGYIERGEEIGSEGSARAYRVARFVEKPDAATASDYLERGFLWNSGIFLWRADVFLEEVIAHAPEVAAHLALLAEGDDVGFFAAVEPVTVDDAVLERSDRVCTAPATFAWDDVGSWEALSRTRPADAQGNVSVGEGHLVDARGNVVFAEGAPVVLFGVDDLVVVRTHGVTLVTTRDRSPSLKGLLERLPERLRTLEGGS